jgi:hypothetical protein
MLALLSPEIDDGKGGSETENSEHYRSSNFILLSFRMTVVIVICVMIV